MVAAIGLYLQNKQLKRDLEKETDYKREAVDHGYAVACLVAIGRRWITNADGGMQGSGFDLVFPDRDLKTRIIMYLGSRTQVGDFAPHQLTADQLGNPECCRTIKDVLAAIEAARQKPWADKLSLPQSATDGSHLHKIPHKP
jgi:hypothetical protein